MNMVIEGTVDALVYIKTGNCRWDSCAGEAIVKSMGGFFTNQRGQPINYDPNATEYHNSEGNVCTFNPQLHQSILQVYAQLESDSNL